MAAVKHPTRSHTLTEDEQRAYLSADQELWDDIKSLLFAELREQAKEEGVTIVLKGRDGQVIETFLAPGAMLELKPQTPTKRHEMLEKLRQDLGLHSLSATHMVTAEGLIIRVSWSRDELTHHHRVSRIIPWLELNTAKLDMELVNLRICLAQLAQEVEGYAKVEALIAEFV